MTTEEKLERARPDRMDDLASSFHQGHLTLHTAESDDPGGSWTFFDGLDAGADFGVLFLAKGSDGRWAPITDGMPWSFGTRGLPDPID